MEANGLVLHQSPIETVLMKGVEVSLLAAGDGTEIIHHKINKGFRWAMTTQEGWTAFESIVILTGVLSFRTENDEIDLHPGHSVFATPVLKDTVFFAKTDVEFIYVSSQPVFHFYSHATKELMDLAISVEQKDGYTASHCNRIKELAMDLGQHMGLSQSDMYQLNFGAFLHDIGKVKIPLEVLNKPGKLTSEEWVIMKRHTDFGAEILQDSKMPSLQAAQDIVRYHHERWDGEGYHGLRGEEIPIGACIVAVVDSYDAMTTHRVYQSARTKEQALDEIVRCRGTMYRPDVVDAFVALSKTWS